MHFLLLIYLSSFLPNFFINEQESKVHKTVLVHNKILVQTVENEILLEINKFRSSKGLPTLVHNEYVSAIARKHSENMANGNTRFSHDGFNERSTIIRQKIPKIYSMAENVAYGYTDAKDVVKGWINSKGHYNNIIGKFSGSGVGVAVTEEGVLYFTQIFI